MPSNDYRRKGGGEEVPRVLSCNVEEILAGHRSGPKKELNGGGGGGT